MSAEPGQGVADTMALAAASVLDSLDPEQRARAAFDFGDNERRRWFYTPTDHGGLALAEMSSTQHRLVWRLVSTGLSEAGFNTAAVIVGQENVLDRFEGFGADFGRERGRDPLLYWVAVFGQPGPTGTWAWRFGGHHVSLNFTIVDNTVVAATPCFFGADPASAPLLGPHLHRPLGAVEDLGRELVHSLDEAQRHQALVAAVAPSDLVGSNRTTLAEGDERLLLPLVWRGRLEEKFDRLMAQAQTNLDTELGTTPEQLAQLAFTAKPKGLAATAMTDAQRELLHELMLTYVGRIHDDLADAQLERVEAAANQLHFLWAGGIEAGQPHYYRIQGGDLFVEYDNAPRSGNHVHTVWRDLRTDFGGDPLAEHYTAGHHAH